MGNRSKNEKDRAKWFSAIPSYVSRDAALISMYLVTEICLNNTTISDLLAKHQERFIITELR